MRIPALHRHRARFVEENLFLHALLGLLSYGRKLESGLAALATESAVHAESEARPARRATSEAPLLAVLGALGLWRRTRSVIEDWAEEAGPTPLPAEELASTGGEPPRSLLR